jgi:hypothetical protein
MSGRAGAEETTGLSLCSGFATPTTPLTSDSNADCTDFADEETDR